jgi:hypothetical protein
MWRTFAVLEGVTKAIGASVQKLVGTSIGTLEMGAIAASIIGTNRHNSDDGWISWAYQTG